MPPAVFHLVGFVILPLLQLRPLKGAKNQIRLLPAKIFKNFHCFRIKTSVLPWPGSHVWPGSYPVDAFGLI